MMSPIQFEELQQLVARRIGLRIPPDAHGRFIGTLHEYAARLGYATLEQYQTFLAGDGADGEWEKIARAFTSSETFFFRDHGQFNLLRMHLLPELMARRERDKTLRLWSAGCASGEEAYSLAMLVEMLLPQHDGWNVLILGTDIDSGAIARARAGRYGQWSFRMVPATMRQRYFHQEEHEWVLDERIRRMVRFDVVNLVDAAFPDPATELHDMDLILCRNLFIYFDADAVSAVAAKFAATLAEQGCLMTAHTELIGHAPPGLESRLFAEGVVYRRRAAPAAPAAPQPPQPAARIAPIRAAPPRPRRAPVRKTQAPSPQAQNPAIAFAAAAQEHANRGEYELAEQLCVKALAADALAPAPYFLLAQLAQYRGDFDQAKTNLDKVIYLDPDCVAAYLELAALHERSGDEAQAHVLRRAALGLARAMPEDKPIAQYERTAGEITRWLAQWEQNGNGVGRQ